MEIRTMSNPVKPLPKATYLVGGAVRDQILGLPVKDRDWVVVGSSQQEMLDAGFKQVGADFPVFLHPQTGEEYALARVERKSGDGYHGFTVRTEGVTVSQDLSRRDLTINSMAIRWGDDGKAVESELLGEGSFILVDPFGGLQDLEARILRHTSCAFAEDPLRVIRLARFVARYDDFSVAPETIGLSKEMVAAGRLNELPYERFWAEIAKVVTETASHKFFSFLNSIGAFKHITFFREIFGENFIKTSDDLEWMITMCNASHRLPETIRMPVLMAVIAKRESFWPFPVGASTEFLKLHQHLNMMKEYHDANLSRDEKIEKTHEFMKMTKPWGEGPHYGHLIHATWLLSQGGRQPYYSPSELEFFREQVKAVNASQFPHLQGKELGVAIDEARKNNLKMAML